MIEEKRIIARGANGKDIALISARDVTESYIENRQNGESVLIIKMPKASEKYREIAQPFNTFEVDGRRYVLTAPGESVTETRDGSDAIIAEIVASEAQQLLSKRYVTVYNSTTKYSQIDKHMVILVSGGTSSFVSNGITVPNPYTKGSAAYALYAILYGSGWSVGIVDVTGTHDLETDKKHIWDNVTEIQKLWGGIFIWDSINKTISLRSEDTYKPYNGFQVRYGKNIKGVTKRQNNDIVTRLYVYGKDNLTIASKNGGKEYIDNFSYTDIVLESVLTNNDISNASELLAWGTAELEKMCRPKVNITTDIVDLREFSGYEQETFSVSDMVDVIDDDLLEENFTARIIYWKYNTFAPYLCSIEIGDESTSLYGKLKKAFKGTDTVTTIVDSTNMIAATAINATDGSGSIANTISRTQEGVTRTQLVVASGFSVAGVEGYGRSGKTEITTNGLTVYDGAIKIKNKSGGTVLYADENGNITLVGKVNGSVLEGCNVQGFRLYIVHADTEGGIYSDKGRTQIIGKLDVNEITGYNPAYGSVLPINITGNVTVKDNLSVTGNINGTIRNGNFTDGYTGAVSVNTSAGTKTLNYTKGRLMIVT